MLGNHNAIATLGVKDIQRAKEFYEGTLGLHSTPDSQPGTAVYQSDKNVLLVYESQFAGTNEATGVTWNVGRDVEELVKSLAAKGVKFQHYDFPGGTREGDIHLGNGMKMAWFKDPDGNIHALMGR